MKAETVKKTNQKTQGSRDNMRLDDVFTGKVLFPNKLAQANEFIAKHPLPDHLQKQKFDQ